MFYSGESANLVPKTYRVWTVEGFKRELNQCSENLINLSLWGEGGKGAKGEILIYLLALGNKKNKRNA